MTFIKLLTGILVGLALLPLGSIVFHRLPLTDPPGFAHRVRAYLTSNVATVEPDSTYPELRSKSYPVSKEELFEAVHEACVLLGWQSIDRDHANMAIDAVVVTRVWGFRDDVRIQVLGLPGGGSELRGQSSSRVGRGDLGANARHLLNLVNTVEKTLASASYVV